MDANGWEVALHKKLSECIGTLHALSENDDLVKLQSIEKVGKLASLLVLIELDVVLLETSKLQLLLVVDVDFNRILHEFFADDADLGSKCGRKHHNLLVVGSGLENLLNKLAHIKLGEHLVTLVNNEVLDVRKIELLALHEILQTTRSTNNNMGLVILQLLDVLVDRSLAHEDSSLDVGSVAAETLKLISDLESKFTSVADDHSAHLAVNGLQLLECGDDKNSGLTHTRLGLAQEIVTQDGLGNALLLNFGRMFETTVNNGTKQLRVENKITETRTVGTNVVTLLSTTGGLILHNGGGGGLSVLIVIEELVIVLKIVLGHFFQILHDPTTPHVLCVDT
eukprot:Colp12_sorted_trinity150504_noHs@29447